MTGSMLLLIVLSLSGCRLAEFLKPNDVKTEELARSIVKLIEEGDEEGLKELFSEKALEECTDFESGFAYAKDLYSGNYETMSAVSYNEQTHYDKGKHSRMVRAEYEVGTSTQTYFLYMYFSQSDTINPSEEGLYRIIFSEDRAKKNYDQYAGIYNPKWDEIR